MMDSYIACMESQVTGEPLATAPVNDRKAKAPTKPGPETTSEQKGDNGSIVGILVVLLIVVVVVVWFLIQ